MPKYLSSSTGSILASNLLGTTLASNVTGSSLTSVGTLTSLIVNTGTALSGNSVALDADITGISAIGTPGFAALGTATKATNIFINNVAGASAPLAAFFKTRAATTATDANTTIVTADYLGDIAFYGADGANFIRTASIRAKSSGTIASTRVPSQLEFYTGTNAAPTVETLALTIDSSQVVTITSATATPFVINSSNHSGIRFSSSGNAKWDLNSLNTTNQFALYNYAGGATAFSIADSTMAAVLTGTLTTASYTSGTPNGGTAGTWKLGIYKTDGVGIVISATNYVQVDIGGTLYRLAVV